MPDRSQGMPLEQASGIPGRPAKVAGTVLAASASAMSGEISLVANAPKEDLLADFAMVELTEGQFIEDLADLGLKAGDGRLVARLHGGQEIVVYPGLEGDDGWVGAAARIRLRGQIGNIEVMTGRYDDVKTCVMDWINRFGHVVEGLPQPIT